VGVTVGSGEVPERNPVIREKNDNNNNIIRDNKMRTCRSILIGVSIS
jgi:hypothetical protein